LPASRAFFKSTATGYRALAEKDEVSLAFC
jgi:hypothetical protein